MLKSTMKKLFSLNLLLNDQNVAYEASFSNEQYDFTPKHNQQQSQAFAIKREGDEWHETTNIPEDLKRQAIDALDKYLLAQH